jgi:hypothetical protein
MICQRDGKSGWKWGESGKCFTGSNGRAQALEQGRAIEASKAGRADRAPAEIQTLVLSKEKFERQSEAAQWAKEHDFNIGNVRETDDSWRILQRSTTDFQEQSFRTIELEPGIQAVIGRLKRTEDSKGEVKKVKISRNITFAR